MADYSISVASFAASVNDIEDDDAQENIVSQLCYRAVENKNRTMLEQLKNGLSSKMSRVMSYGLAEYPYGLPEGEVIYYDLDLALIKSTIEAEVGYAVEITTADVNLPDAQYFGAYKVQTSGDLYLGNNSNQIYVTVKGIDSKNRVVINYNYIYGQYDEEYSFTPALQPEEYYYQVRYRPFGEETTRDDGFWFYRQGEGSYPALDAKDTTRIGAPYLPIIPFRQDNINLGPEFNEDGSFKYDDNGFLITPDTDLYRTSKYLCKLCNTDYDDLCKGINENPDVNDIDHAYMMFGVDIRTPTKAGKRYLYEFFLDLSYTAPTNPSISIKDLKFDVQIIYDKATRNIITGQVSEETKLTYSGNTLTLEHNISSTQYNRVVITGLKHRNRVYAYKYVDTTLAGSADEDDYNFIIPLNLTIAKKIQNRFWREALYNESLKIVFNSFEIKKLKWYQSSWFRVITILIAIVVTVFTGFGGAILTALSEGLVAVVTLAIEAAIVSYLTSTAFQLLAEQLGVEIAVVLAIVTLAVAGAVGAGVDLGDLLTADNLLAFSNGLVTGINATNTANMEKIAEQIADFTSTASELDAELSELEDELNSETWFDAFDFIGNTPLFVVGETPEAYYNRTIHIGNIGAFTLLVAETYVDDKLVLPTPEDIGDFK